MVPCAFQVRKITFSVIHKCLRGKKIGLQGAVWIKFESSVEVILKMHAVHHLHQMLTYINAVAK